MHLWHLWHFHYQSRGWILTYGEGESLVALDCFFFFFLALKQGIGHKFRPTELMDSHAIDIFFLV